MAIAPPHLPQNPAAIAADRESIMRMVSSLSSVPAVRKVRYRICGGILELWVLIPTTDPDTASHVYEIEREYMAATGTSTGIDVHVVPMDVVAEENLPSNETLFER